MSQKKKLILSPLPEQAEDYSQYSETVTRWDRVIIVLVVIALIVGGIIYALSGDENEGHNGHGEQNQAEEKQIASQATQKPKQELTNNNLVKAASTTPALQSTKTKPSETKLLNNPEATNSSESILDENASLPDNSKKLSATKPANTTALSLPKPATVKIKNNAISRAVLTQEIKDKEPVSQLPSTLTLPEAGIIKAILFTEMNGLRGQTLYHEWYKEGVRQARVKIPVNVSKQRSYSSKYINTQMVGNWQVKVLDEKSKVFALADFKVINP